MAYYMVTTGNGDLLCNGVFEHEIERIAQALANCLVETVYYTKSSTAPDDEDIVIAVEPHTVRCGCSAWTGERCVWTGPKSQTVLVEFIPKYLRASLQAAGIAGFYPPDNNAECVRVSRYCAELLLSNDDERDWAQVVGN